MLTRRRRKKKSAMWIRLIPDGFVEYEMMQLQDVKKVFCSLEAPLQYQERICSAHQTKSLNTLNLDHRPNRLGEVLQGKWFDDGSLCRDLLCIHLDSGIRDDYCGIGNGHFRHRILGYKGGRWFGSQGKWSDGGLLMKLLRMLGVKKWWW